MTKHARAARPGGSDFWPISWNGTRFMDVGGAADSADVLGDIRVKGGFVVRQAHHKRKRCWARVGWKVIRRHSSSFVVWALKGSGETANRVGMARRGGQEAEEGKLPHSISNFIISGGSRECRVPLRLRSPRQARGLRFAPTGRAGAARRRASPDVHIKSQTVIGASRKLRAERRERGWNEV